MHKLKGFGLPNVFLVGGVSIEGSGEDETIAFCELDGLLSAVATAIATRSSPLTPSELRFLRKRMDLTQAGIGALGGKSSQVAAKWENGTLPVPPAEGNLIRLAWLAKHAPKSVLQTLMLLLQSGAAAAPADYVLQYDGKRWLEVPALPVKCQWQYADTVSTVAIAEAIDWAIAKFPKHGLYRVKSIGVGASGNYEAESSLIGGFGLRPFELRSQAAAVAVARVLPDLEQLDDAGPHIPVLATAPSINLNMVY